MCGIAGILRADPSPEDRDLVDRMLQSIRHRGPDGSGVAREGPLTVGHRRLAILDLSEAASQPMRSADGRYLLTYNGEIYNYLDLRDALGLKAADLRSHSDTEILLRGWERWGPAVLDRMAGQWAFAMYDRDERTLWLARDRFGEKPLFYHRSGEGLAFGSSLAALLQLPWVPREIDPSALGEYLTLRYVVSPRTILSGIHKVPPGHLVRVHAGGVESHAWYAPRFHPPDATRGRRTRGELVEEFGEVFTRACRRCLVSDVPVALLLSEGLDSNAIRIALRAAGSDLPALTFWRGGPSPTAPRYQAEADLLHLPFTHEERLRHLVPAFQSFTEPVGDGAAQALWLLIRAARPRATVFLCGNGGDEVLGGYRLDQDLLRLRLIRRFAWLPHGALGGALARYSNGAEEVPARQRALRRATAAQGPAAARYLIHKPLPAPEVADLFAPGAAPDPYLGVIDRLYAGCDPAAGDLDRVQEVMLRTFLSENILSFSDSVAMASSAELRMPFLDKDLVAFVLGLPPRARVRNRSHRPRTKMMLRWWGRERFEAAGVAAKKRTFNFGGIRYLLAERPDEVRGLVLESRALRRRLPGLERWLGRPAELFRGPYEGTLWGLLALGVWCEGAGVV